MTVSTHSTWQQWSAYKRWGVLGPGGCLVAFWLSIRDIDAFCLVVKEPTFSCFSCRLLVPLWINVTPSVPDLWWIGSGVHPLLWGTSSLKHQVCSWMNLVFESIRTAPSWWCIVVARLREWGCFIVFTVFFCAEVCCICLLMLSGVSLSFAMRGMLSFYRLENG